MAVEVKKKPDESTEELIRRFNKRVIESGILKEAKKRQFKGKNISRRLKRINALYRLREKEAREYFKKIGFLSS
jgi:ribosomal protein S21